MEISLPDRTAAMVWIIDNQLARRNLNNYQRTILALRREEEIAKQAKENLKTSTGGAHPQPLPNSGKAAIDTEDKLAKQADVSHDTIWKVKQIQEKATPEQKEKLVEGGATINQVYQKVKRAEVKQKVKEAEWPTGKY